jgi:hypothetical protein
LRDSPGDRKKVIEIQPTVFTHHSRGRLMQPVVELVGGEEASFVGQFADGGKVGGG